MPRNTLPLLRQHRIELSMRRSINRHARQLPLLGPLIRVMEASTHVSNMTDSPHTTET